MGGEQKLTEKQIKQAMAEERNAYMREWRKKNPDKVRESNSRYWRRRVEKKLEAANADNRENRT